METRSQTRYEKSALYEVNIDFDEASALWRQNKKHIGQGHFNYICTAVKKDGKTCCKTVNKNNDYCWVHRGYNKKEKEDK